MSDDEDDWDPTPAQLRDGEKKDVDSHAAKNIEQIRQAEREGIYNKEEADEKVERMRESQQQD